MFFIFNSKRKVKIQIKNQSVHKNPNTKYQAPNSKNEISDSRSQGFHFLSFVIWFLVLDINLLCDIKILRQSKYFRIF